MSVTRVQLMSPDSLSDELLHVWRSHQAADENLRGPFFNPEYIRLVASVRPDVRVAVIEAPGQLPAFFPFQQDSSRVARPVGLRACDFSGIIAAPGYPWSPEMLIRACRLAGWDFAHVEASDPAMRPYIRAVVSAPYIDLRDGFEPFVKKRGHAGSDLFKSVAQKIRKMEREIASMRFEPHSSDPHALARLFEWKAAQRERTGTFDVLGTPWMRRFVDRLLETGTETFAGLFSVLYAGDQVAAGAN